MEEFGGWRDAFSDFTDWLFSFHGFQDFSAELVFVLEVRRAEHLEQADFLRFQVGDSCGSFAYSGVVGDGFGGDAPPFCELQDCEFLADRQIGVTDCSGQEVADVDDALAEGGAEWNDEEARPKFARIFRQREYQYVGHRPAKTATRLRPIRSKI